jgi:hypothetical protein
VVIGGVIDIFVARILSHLFTDCLHNLGTYIISVLWVFFSKFKKVTKPIWLIESILCGILQSQNGYVGLCKFAPLPSIYEKSIHSRVLQSRTGNKDLMMAKMNWQKDPLNDSDDESGTILYVRLETFLSRPLKHLLSKSIYISMLIM